MLVGLLLRGCLLLGLGLRGRLLLHSWLVKLVLLLLLLLLGGLDLLLLGHVCRQVLLLLLLGVQILLLRGLLRGRLVLLLRGRWLLRLLLLLEGVGVLVHRAGRAILLPRILGRVLGLLLLLLGGRLLLDWQHVLLNALDNHFDHLLGVGETLDFLDEGLVHLREMQLLLAVWQVLQIDEEAVGHAVRVVEHLVLLEVHLQSLLVGEVLQHCLFEFDEVLHVRQLTLHPSQSLDDRRFDLLQVALRCLLPGPLRLVEASLVLVVEVLADAGLAERNLVGHAEGVDDTVVLVAVEHARLDGLRHHLLGGLLKVVLSHLLRVVHVCHVLLRVVHRLVLGWLALAAHLAGAICLVHIVTHRGACVKKGQDFEAILT